MKIETALYSAYAKATGGREGRATSSDGILDVMLSTPKELGGTGGKGTNPEQLFAAGYSACFLGAIKFVAIKRGITLPDESTVHSRVGIGKIETGFGIEVDLEVHLPDIDYPTARDLAEEAHIVCPYSNATRNNINVEIKVTT